MLTNQTKSILTRGDYRRGIVSSAIFALLLVGCGGSSKDTTAPTITVSGDNPATIAYNTTYTDSGATANDDKDGNVNVTSSGAVNTSMVGSYTITYTAVDAAGNETTATRTVNVVDIVAPVISVTGNSTVNLFVGDTYTDNGATATDDYDSAVTVSSSGDVDTSTVGSYTVTYTAVDAAGNSSTQTRTINVSAPMLTGTAAAGAAIVGTVTVKDALGATKQKPIEADGTYTVDVSGMTPPFRLRAEGTVGGKTYKLHSYAESATPENKVNITPFTDLIIANTAQQIAEAYFDNTSATALDTAELAAQETALQAKLQDVFDAVGLDDTIDLLNMTFSADHSGLDAALDIIQIETDGDTNIATITNLLDNSSIEDDISDTEDNTETIVVNDEDVATAVDDAVAIFNLFNQFGAKFAEGLPTSEEITPFFASNFLQHDQSLTQFLTDITTDPNLVGLGFTSVSVRDLDSAAGTALVDFNVKFGDNIDRHPETWQVKKDSTLGWQLLGNQYPVDAEWLTFHCNDYDGKDQFDGGCGFNVAFWDNDATNNGTNGALFSSATVTIVDGETNAIKDIVYLNAENADGEIFVYNQSTGQYQGDWVEFGDLDGQVSASNIKVGDIIEYRLYTSALDLSTPSQPSITQDMPDFMFSTTILYAPETVGRYPSISDATYIAMADFNTSTDLNVEWQLPDGLVIEEVWVEVRDNQGNSYDIGDEIYGSEQTSVTIDTSLLDVINTDINFDEKNFTLIVRIYSIDPLTGQSHSTDFRKQFVDDGTSTGGGGGTTELTCNTESPWDDVNEKPTVFYSIEDFETVVTDCATNMTLLAFTVSDLADKTWYSEDERLVFDNSGQTAVLTSFGDDETLGTSDDETYHVAISQYDNNTLEFAYSETAETPLLGKDLISLIKEESFGGKTVYVGRTLWEYYQWTESDQNDQDLAHKGGEIYHSAYSSAADFDWQAWYSGVDPTPATVTCETESPWDDVNDKPTVFYSIADLKTSIADCASTKTLPEFTSGNLSNVTWYVDDERIVFDPNGSSLVITTYGDDGVLGTNDDETFYGSVTDYGDNILQFSYSETQGGEILGVDLIRVIEQKTFNGKTVYVTRAMWEFFQWTESDGVITDLNHKGGELVHSAYAVDADFDWNAYYSSN